MAGRRKREINRDAIVDLLGESDVDDFTPSDEDMGDPPFEATKHNADTDSDSDRTSVSSTGSITNISSTVRDIGRGQRRTRGRDRGRSQRRGRGNIPTSSTRRGLSATVCANISWVSKVMPTKEYLISEPSYLPNFTENFNKLDFFQQYVSQGLIDVIIECTNRTSVARQGRSLNLDSNEFYVYLGITFIMSAINYPSIRMFWEEKWRVPMIADNMSRNRFGLLRNSIKVVFDEDVNDDIRKNDKLWRMRPLIQYIRQGCRIQVKAQRLSLDEMMIPFTGSCGIKQYCPGKPNPVGLKAFVLSNPDGLVVDFTIYQGSTTYPDLESTDFGVGEKAVLSLTDSLVAGHIIYFDRYFTTVKLAKELAKRGICCTGTIQKNRVPSDARSVLIDDATLKRRGRGSVHCITNEDDTIAIVKWFDNKPVTLLSSVESREPMDVCQRWCKRTKQYVQVNRPLAVRNYNQYMGGVDLADRMLSVCPNRYRTKKWTQRFFSHMMDLAVSNSWITFKNQAILRGVLPKRVQQLRQFKLELGETLIERHINIETTRSSDSETDIPIKRYRGKPPSTPMPSNVKRTTAAKHMPSFQEKQSRCRHCHYNMSRTKCTTCNVQLCLTKNRNCYMQFHQT